MLMKMRKRRKELRPSQVKLASLCDIASSHISDFELGKQTPWPRARSAIAKALCLSESELFGEVK